MSLFRKIKERREEKKAIAEGMIALHEAHPEWDCDFVPLSLSIKYAQIKSEKRRDRLVRRHTRRTLRKHYRQYKKEHPTNG